MKRILIILFIGLLGCMPAHAVLKEQNLGNTLSILRSELTTYQHELEAQSDMMKHQREKVLNDLMDIMNRSNQNSLMLYSQRPDYIFDLTYACHEATEQFARFQANVAPFRSFIDRNDYEIARYDSLIVSLSQMTTRQLSERARIDRNVCLTLAVNIRHTLRENSAQMNDYITYYQMTERRLSHLNDYANERYHDIQQSIFRNGGDDYFSILRNFRYQLTSARGAIAEKYLPKSKIASQWDINVIIHMTLVIIICFLLASVVNVGVIRLLARRKWLPQSLMTKQKSLSLLTTVMTIAVALGLIQFIYKEQNFIIMASSLLVEYAWLLVVILASLLIRLTDQQIMSAFRIYAPLLVIGFIVIAFRIILIPNDLVNLIFPPILLICMIWQWIVISRHNSNIPRSDVFYTYISLVVFIAAVVSSWIGYTLLSVQLLIWWIMQLTFILTITCIQGLLKSWATAHHYDVKPITKTWFYKFINDAALPILGVFSVMISIYWAADVFNLSDTTREIFSRDYVNSTALRLSIVAVAQVLNLYFIFRYVNVTLQQLLRLYFEKSDMSTAGTRNIMMKNIIQLTVWGTWLLLSLAILHVNNKWLGIVAAGFSTGIGFAMKDILENIYYGVSLMAGRLKVGDLVICDGIRGKIASISYTSTMIEAVDGSIIAFTNSQMFTKNYKNLTKNHGYELVGLEVGVAYGTDIEHARQLIIQAITDLGCCDPKRKPTVKLLNFGDSSVNLKVNVWLSVLNSYGDSGRVLEAIYNTLNENGIEIPFPQRDLHIITDANA